MNDTLKLGLKLFIICFIAAVALGAVYSITKEPIAEQEQLASDTANKAVLSQENQDAELEDLFIVYTEDEKTSDAYDEAKDATLQPWYDTTAHESLQRVIVAKKDGLPVSYIVKASPKGYAGAITMTVGVNPADNTVTNVAIGANSETPGLGAKITEDSFIGQFENRDASAALNAAKIPSAQTDVQAITGATISSRAVTNAVNMSVEVVNAIPEQ